MTTRPPAIAVLMPVYNAEAFIDQAVRSIRGQSFTDFELIIVDDGSSDDSLAILREHAQEDRRITLISRPNTGLVGALNEMADVARSPLLARMDADDIALPDRFQRQLDWFSRHPRTVCLGGRVELIAESGQPLESPDPVTGNDRIQQEALAGRTPLSHPAVMMRAEAFQQVGGYRDEAYPAEDLDLFLRLGELGELHNLPETVLRYRMHGGSVSVQHSKRQIQKMRQACEAAWSRRGITGRFGVSIEAKPQGDENCPILANPTASALAGRA